MARVGYPQEFYCGFGGRRYKQGEEKRDKRGRAICPKCGNPMRKWARGKNNR